MASHGHIHVIDPDFRRRARITFELAQRNLHAEIYEDLEEFGSRIPDGGAIFIADEAGRCNARDVRAMLDRLGRPLPVAASIGESAAIIGDPSGKHQENFGLPPSSQPTSADKNRPRPGA